MGFDYALVHLKYTIPPALALTALYRPLLTRLDLYKIGFLISIAVVSTIPWDSYLIHQRIWTYPAHVVAGPTLFAIPIEELFFFVIQTYNTTLLYLFLSKPLLHPAYLVATTQGRERRWRLPLAAVRTGGQTVLGLLIAWGVSMVVEAKQATYMGLILIWAGPFLFLLWSLAYQFVVGLPRTSTLWPIVVPTLYLWIVDTLALQRGTWVIESDTKLGIQIWKGLEIEEAVFFLATNTLIVFGLVAFDNAIAVLELFPALFPPPPTLPWPSTLVRALLISSDRYRATRVAGIAEALARLRAKSRSFYLASAVFTGRLRIDLVLLYSFARAADDMIDNAETSTEAELNCSNLRKFLDLCYGSFDDPVKLEQFLQTSFPDNVQNALRLLPTSYLSERPLYELLEGFHTDLQFDDDTTGTGSWPITTEADLDLYAMRVAGTVAELCLELVFYHNHTSISAEQRRRLVKAGGRMGVALQCVNIARDIAVDANINRVYVPTSWLKDAGMTPEDLVRHPNGASAEALRHRMLDKAEGIYDEARPAINELPPAVRGPMAVAVESYMEIGRVLREKNYNVKAGRATVPKLRRLRVGWKTLSSSK
ncbi:MAG: hypothetical protein M4579_004368 [Chaenotheca gracillima]|nr:MAG: hypothetical protein M4579_004368 [Chaenotheca gracillima]